MAIQATQDFTWLAVPIFQELVDAVVAVQTDTIFFIKVLIFITLNTVSMVVTIQTVRNVTRIAAFSFKEVIKA